MVTIKIIDEQSAAETIADLSYGVRKGRRNVNQH
jgi:hypothetical protein